MRGKEEIKKTIEEGKAVLGIEFGSCLLYTSPSPRDCT